MNPNTFSIINNDTEYGEFMKSGCSNNVFDFGINGKIKIIDYCCTLDKTIINLNYDNQNITFETQLIGKHNVYNFIGAISYFLIHNYDISKLVEISKNLVSPKGRLHKIKNVFVDYAHTPDGIKTILQSLREINQNNKIILVFGAGGNRDSEKRKFMGLEAKADYVIVTNDNPRYEEEENIANMIYQHVNCENKEIILDRKIAIIKAITMAKNDDIVLVLGKGNEQFISYKGIKIPHNDIEFIEKLFSFKN